MTSPPRAVGVSIAKKDAPAKVTGAAQYIDDITRPGMWHGATVRSPHAAARILSITLDRAFDWDGVTVVTAADIDPARNCIHLIVDDQPALVRDVVRHAEEPVALVACEDRERLADAVAHVQVEYEVRPSVFDIDEALAVTVPVHGADNLLKALRIERGAVDRAFARALARGETVIEGEYRVGHQEHIYIEPNGMLAWFEDDGTCVVQGSLQCPYYVHKALVPLLDLPEAKVRVIQAVTGGGFGGKEEYPSMLAAHAALLARKSGRPVKMIYDRAEDIAATTKRHPGRVRIRSVVKPSGAFVAHDIDIVLDGGAYVTLSPVVLSRGALHAGGPYRCPHVRIEARAVATNTPPNGAFRGFGAPQTLFAMETHVEHIAATLGLDAVALRRRNLLRPGDIMPTGQLVDETCAARETFEAALKASRFVARRRAVARFNAGAQGREALPASRRGVPAFVDGSRSVRRVRRGLGLSMVMHGAGFTGSGETMLASIAAVELAPTGHPRVLAASTEIGQGTQTVFAQIAADALGVSADCIEIATPDTALVPNSGPTVASRTVMVVGGLIERATRRLREQLRATGAIWHDDASFLAASRAYLAQHGALRIDEQYAAPLHVDWDDVTYTGAAYATYAWMATVMEIEVDLDTFTVTPRDVVAVAEIGTAIHPRLAEGQIEGGLSQALGWALLEEVRWREGRVWNQQLTNYIIPTSLDVPPMAIHLLAHAYPGGPYGAKGVGELPMDGGAPAVVAAVRDAIGVLPAQIPLLPERLRELLEGTEIASCA